MSTYVLMRILESAPRRYEFGIRVLTLGCAERAYDRLASHIRPGQQVLDLGCGTGALTLRAARHGARVKGIDINTAMLEVATQQARQAGLMEAVEFVEMGIAELDTEESERYDAVMSGLLFSELSQDELTYTLKQIVRILRPGGLLLVADEIRPEGLLGRGIHSLIRAPLAALAYIVTQQTTRPVSNLPGELRKAGLSIVSTHSSLGGSFWEFVTCKAGGPSP